MRSVIAAPSILWNIRIKMLFETEFHDRIFMLENSRTRPLML